MDFVFKKKRYISVFAICNKFFKNYQEVFKAERQ